MACRVELDVDPRVVAADLEKGYAAALAAERA